MAQQLKGVGGVLEGLISPDLLVAKPEVILDRREKSTSVPAGDAEGPKPHQHGARRGRPPGTRAGEELVREKTTLRLDKRLMDEYRDWSWEERCQLGELVERALNHYRKQRSRRKAD
jgi:hypothetical protein